MLVEETIEEKMVRMYKEEKKSIFKIAMELNVSERRVSKTVDSIKRYRSIDTMISDDVIIRMHKKGMTHQQMADELKVSRRSVFRKLKGLGLTKKRRSQDVKKPSFNLLQRMFVVRRMSIKEISDHFKTSKPIVQKWLDDYEITRELSKITLEMKVDLYKRYVKLNTGRGMPSFEELYTFYVTRAWLAEEMAFEYGVSLGRVRAWLHARGINRHTKADVVDNFGFSPSTYIPLIGYAEFAELVGLTRSTVTKYLATAKKELERRGELVDE